MDSFTDEEKSKMRERFPAIFGKNSEEMNEVDRIYEAELSKPPYLSLNEIIDLQVLFEYIFNQI